MTEEQKCQVIANCESFEELNDAFEKIGEIKGSHKEYSVSTLKHKVQQLQILLGAQGFHGRLPFNILTRTYGIRAKAMELSWYKANDI